jgi:dolichol-phosphate mannosyltransferase
VNEYENIRILIPQLRELHQNTLILVIDDNSSDSTRDYLERLKLTDEHIETIYRNQRGGIGSAHIAAMKYALDSKAKFLITMDADLTHDPLDVFKLLSEIQEHNDDVVIGSRFLGRRDIRGWSKFRFILTHMGHLMTKLFFKSDLDMSSGLRAYRVDKIPIGAIHLNCPQNYEFFFISTLVFLKSKMQINQVRVQLSRRGEGKSKMSIGLMARGLKQLLLFGTRLMRIQL